MSRKSSWTCDMCGLEIGHLFTERPKGWVGLSGHPQDFCSEKCRDIWQERKGHLCPYCGGEGDFMIQFHTEELTFKLYQCPGESISQGFWFSTFRKGPKGL